MSNSFKLPPKPSVMLVDPSGQAQRALTAAGFKLPIKGQHAAHANESVKIQVHGAASTLKGISLPPTPGDGIGSPQQNFPEESARRGRRRRRNDGRDHPKLSLKPPHTKFAVIPSRAITDPRINTRKPLLLLLAAIGIHASVHGICYPSQRRLAMLCGKSNSWANKYLHELIRMGYVRRLVPPKIRGKRQALRLQVMWSTTQPLPGKETDWEDAPWCWR
jgi:hypothetical protein